MSDTVVVCITLFLCVLVIAIAFLVEESLVHKKEIKKAEIEAYAKRCDTCKKVYIKNKR